MLHIHLIKTVCFLFFVSIVSCNTSAKQKKTAENKPLPFVLLQPLQSFDKSVLSFLKDSIEKFYPVHILIADQKSFPANSYYKPRNRYRADSTIDWLRSIKADTVRLIVGLTDSDISTTKGTINDYGVMGLGFHPGNACIVSTFRIKKSATSKQNLRQRIFKVVVHEMGHNFGLAHCPDQHCIMADAEGKMKLDGENDLCVSCRKKLKI